MKESVRLGRIAGIAVGFNWTLLLIAGFLALGLGGTRFPVDAPGYSQSAYTLAGLLTAVAFLGGVLTHEMSHALVARHEGLKVDGIVLWLMGGYTKISETPRTPGSELRISGAGPLVSLLIGLGCGVAAAVAHAVGVSPLAVSVLTWLGMINVLLAVFNVLPGSPLDGGRIMHAAVWWRTGDKYRATRVASRAGSLLGAGLVAVGIVSAFSGRTGFDGLSLAIVGGFLMMASRAEGGASQVLESLEGLRAADVMAQPGVGPGWLTVDAFLREYAVAGPGGVRPPAFLVEQWGGGLAGLTPTVAMEAVPLMHRTVARAGDLALPVAAMPVFAPETAAGEVVTQMNERGAAWALVVASGQIVGVVFIDAMAAATQQARAAQAVDSSSWTLTRG
ncbi:MAG: site-2 protease family protein [Actinomycetota bacterium]|nr:site-2 protease family protein [Actinomycetota bacterium]MDQ6947051.1 site-2 protease family protein [Actinomycetota bacterium]